MPAILAIIIAVTAGAGAKSTHPVTKLGAAITRYTHRCAEPICERCSCADGYRCVNWKHVKESDTVYAHTNDCVLGASMPAAVHP